MKPKYKKLADGRWTRPIAPQADGTYVHRIKCCDCGLVHVVQEKVTRRGLSFRAWRGD